MKTQDFGRDLVVDNFGIPFNLLDSPEEPKDFEEAFNHPNIEKK
jgi:hypothetical protein